MKRLLLITTATLGLLMTAAHAENFCGGIVQSGPQWTDVVDNTDETDGCRFLTASTLGQRILAACPNGSRCQIIVLSEDKRANRAAIRELCPNPNARCLARDNPQFSPELHRTIIKAITNVAKETQ